MRETCGLAPTIGQAGSGFDRPLRIAIGSPPFPSLAVVAKLFRWPGKYSVDWWLAVITGGGNNRGR